MFSLIRVHIEYCRSSRDEIAFVKKEGYFVKLIRILTSRIDFYCESKVPFMCLQIKTKKEIKFYCFKRNKYILLLKTF